MVKQIGQTGGHLSRRQALSISGATLAAGLAGCFDSGPSIPSDAVEDLPTPTRGDSEAPITVEVFEDFGCPHCRSFNEQVAPAIISNYVETGYVTFEWRDFPLPVTDMSWPAAIAARAVQDRAGNDAFWQYKTYLFDNQDQLSYELLTQAADELDLDGEAVANDADNNMYRPVVQSDKDDGKDRGVSGTPTVFVDGNKVDSPSEQAISARIEQQIQA